MATRPLPGTRCIWEVLRVSHVDEADWRELLVGVLRSYVDFRQTTGDEDEEFRYRAPLVEWWADLTEGFQKGRLAVQKDEQTITGVKRWVSKSVVPLLAVICAIPGGERWLMREIASGDSRWKPKHWSLLKKRHKGTSSSPAGGLAGGQL